MTRIQNASITQMQEQIKERATLSVNKTGVSQEADLFFVQFDDFYAVGSDDSIYQILSKNEKDFSPTLVYEGENFKYNYAEDSDDFEEGSEDRRIFEECKQQAELLNNE